MSIVRLFDKAINLSLHRNDGNVVNIVTPSTGRKYAARINGRLVSQNILQQVELRLTNFETDVPLSEYGLDPATGKQGWIEVTAGYASSLTTAFRANVLVSFQEIPSPDGITCFQCIIGDLDLWMSATFSGKYSKGTSLESVMMDVAARLKLDLEYSAGDLKLKIDLPWNGLVKDLFSYIEGMYPYREANGVWSGLRIAPYGNKLLVYRANVGTGVVTQLDYISHARHSAAGFAITAPWLPSLRPMDTLKIDPKYFRQDFGGSQVKRGNLYTVYMIDFSFENDGDENQMTVYTVGAEG